MKERIYPKKIKGKTYYYLQSTIRVKINPNDKGKTKGSGKSRVKTKSTYLGTAETIKKKLFGVRDPLQIHHRNFGFVGAIYNVAEEIGLVELLQKHITGERFGIPNWIYFLLAIINRLQNATSKEKMGSWAAKTVLPDILEFDPSRLNSKSFWYATDDVMSERILKERRKQKPDLKDEIFTGIEDSIFNKIEEELIVNLREKLDFQPEVIFYDTTNFFTYFEEPVRSVLAKTGHNKASKDHLKQIGLALCVDKEWGIPLFHRIYRGNSHDSKTFSAIISDIISSVKNNIKNVNELVLVLDKGNNSFKNFKRLEGELEWIGSLIVSNYADLLDLPLNSYHGKYKDFRYFQLEREVMGSKAKLVLTYNEKLARKQSHSLYNGINKLENKISKIWFDYKQIPKRVPKGIKNELSKSHYGKYVKVRCRKGKPEFILDNDQIKKKEKVFGKNLLFSSNVEAESADIIEQYRSKDKVEKGFKLLKDPDLIRWQPMRHWTDSKIRAFAFCCVMSLVLIRVMELKVENENLKMSPAVLKQELMDLQEIISVYDENTAQRKISSRSTVQQKLWNIFKLDTIESKLTIH